MPLDLKGWMAATDTAMTQIGIVRDLSRSIDNGKAVPVGLEGAKYEAPMSTSQLNTLKQDRTTAARLARDTLTAAIQADAAP